MRRAFEKEMLRFGKHAVVVQDDTHFSYDTWTNKEGCVIAGKAVNNEFDLDRVFVPVRFRRSGKSKRMLRFVARAADKTHTTVYAMAYPDNNRLHRKWVEAMRKYGGFRVDVKRVMEYTRMSEREVIANDRKHHRDELIRLPK